METWDALRARRNVRTYDPRPIADEDMHRILEAGWRAPSASNRQHWDFILVTDKSQLADLATVWQGAGHIPGSTATVCFILKNPDDERMRVVDQYDLGQATYAMMIAAADLGIGTAHSSVGDQDAGRRILGYPEDRYFAYMMGVGYPGDRPLKPIVTLNRRPFDEVVHRGRW